MKKPKNIIFDVGDVLLDYRWQQMLMDYGLDESEAYRVGRELCDDPDGLWHEFDLGVKSQEEIIQEVALKTNGFKDITKSACEKLITGIGEMIEKCGG